MGLHPVLPVLASSISFTTKKENPHARTHAHTHKHVTRGRVLVRVHQPQQEIAQAIADGQVVAWFQGRGEFGPRALGSRSLLADPRDPGMPARINADVKKRCGVGRDERGGVGLCLASLVSHGQPTPSTRGLLFCFLPVRVTCALRSGKQPSCFGWLLGCLVLLVVPVLRRIS